MTAIATEDVDCAVSSSSPGSADTSKSLLVEPDAGLGEENKEDVTLRAASSSLENLDLSLAADMTAAARSAPCVDATVRFATPDRPLNPRIAVSRDWLQRLVAQHVPSYRLGDPMWVCAPMVDQSDLPFRLLTRRYGCHVAFTPMIHSRLFQTNLQYRQKFFPRSDPQRGISFDKPLIAQLCGYDPETVLQTALDVQPYVDAIDLNCGCPQNIAKRGQYGAFLLEQPETLLAVVRTLTRHLHIPVSVKVRLLPASTQAESVRRSLQLYQRLIDEGGIHMLTIHGRTRLQKGPDKTVAADWHAIQQAVQLLGHSIPILANGSITCLQDAIQCAEQTGVDGVMSSEALLEYPALFERNNNPRRISRLQLAQEYMDLAAQYPPNHGGQGSGLKCMRIHIHRILHADLQQEDVDEIEQEANNKGSTQGNHPHSKQIKSCSDDDDLDEAYEAAEDQIVDDPDESDELTTKCNSHRPESHRVLGRVLQTPCEIRKAVVDATCVEDLQAAINALQVQRLRLQQEKFQEQNNFHDGYDVAQEKLSWYFRHRTDSRQRHIREATVKSQELLDDAADCFACLFDE